MTPRLFLIAWIVLGGALPLVLAQETTHEEESRDETSRYAPPPAWKSVEIANFYFKRGKFTAALSRYQEAVTTDPHYPPGYLGLGKVYEKIGLKEKALGAYQKYLDTLPSTKQAEEAKQVHQAIARLERQLKKGGSRH